MNEKSASTASPTSAPEDRREKRRHEEGALNVGSPFQVDARLVRYGEVFIESKKKPPGVASPSQQPERLIQIRGRGRRRRLRGSIRRRFPTAVLEHVGRAGEPPPPVTFHRLLLRPCWAVCRVWFRGTSRTPPRKTVADGAIAHWCEPTQAPHRHVWPPPTSTADSTQPRRPARPRSSPAPWPESTASPRFCRLLGGAAFNGYLMFRANWLPVAPFINSAPPSALTTKLMKRQFDHRRRDQRQCLIDLFHGPDRRFFD